MFLKDGKTIEAELVFKRECRYWKLVFELIHPDYTIEGHWRVLNDNIVSIIIDDIDYHYKFDYDKNELECIDEPHRD
jgi:hypothetical protein